MTNVPETPSPPPIETAALPKPHTPFPSKILIGILIVVILMVYGALYYFVINLPKRSDSVTQNKPTVERIKQHKKIIIGTDATYQPMEFFDEMGKFAGFDIELGNRIAEKMGVQAEYKNIVFDDILNALARKEIDIVISSVSITDERKQKFDFSDSYLNAGQVIITNRENETIKSTKDLYGKKIAVQKGTTNEEQAYQFTSRELVVLFDDFNGASSALKEKKVDAIFSDLTGAKGIITANPTLKIASDPFTNEQYGIVFRKDEPDLVLEVNSILNSLRQQGVLVYLKQKWLE